MRAHKILLVLAGLFLVASTASAQSSGSATFGGQWWTQNKPEAKYREYRAMPRGGFLENYVLRESNGGWDAFLWGENALEEDQHNYLSLSKGVNFRVDAEYTGVPHLYSDVARSPFSQVRPGVFVLPDSIQRIMQNGTGGTAATYTAALRDLLNGASPVSLKMQTDVSKLRARMRPAQGWQFEVKGTQRQRSGSLALGVPFGIGSSTMSEIASPIEQKMLDVDATGIWTHKQAKVLATVGISKFENEVSTIFVDNSRRLTASTSSGTAVAAMDMYPNNDVLRGRLSFMYELPYASLFSVTYGVSKGEQTDDLLPYTSNTALAYSSLDSLPARKAGEKFTETVIDARLSGRPAPKLYGAVRFRDEKYEKDSDEIVFKGFSPYDAGFTANVEENILWGSKRSTIGLDLDYDLVDWADVTLLAEHKAREHEHREVEKDAENVFGVTLKLRPMSDVDLSIGGKLGNRELDEILLEDYEDANGVFVEPAGLRRYDVADRKQTVGTFAANWMVNDRLDLSVSMNSTKDDYENSVYGLQWMENGMAWGEANFHATKTLDLSGGYGFGQVLSRMASSEYSAPNRPDTASTMDWWLNERDRNVFVFTHADWWMKPKKVLFKADYTYSRAMSEYRMSNVTTVRNGSRRAAAQDVPNTFYRSHDVMLECKYMYTKSVDLGLRYDYMAFHVDDFAVMNVPLLGGSYTGTGGAFAPNAIYLGDSYQSYIAHRVAVLATKRF